jgi:5-methyltetrahydrofolate--homocysteine methyltransferase
MGGYDETPEMFAESIKAYAMDGIVNMVGGCCGTGPEFIKSIKKAVEGIERRNVPHLGGVGSPHISMFSGLTEFIFRSNIPFVNVGERCNISGSI